MPEGGGTLFVGLDPVATVYPKKHLEYQAYPPPPQKKKIEIHYFDPPPPPVPPWDKCMTTLSDH